MFGLFKRPQSDGSKMETVNAKGIVCAGPMEHACRIRQYSEDRMVLILDRAAALSDKLVIIDLKNGLAFDAALIVAKGTELTLSVSRRHDLRGLVPARLSRARDLFKRI